MARTFLHTFEPPGLSPVNRNEVELTVQEIEDAGLREVLQTPGVPVGSWALLEALLAPGVPFVFREPLGHAREVKVALSGLFGRFVARAYLERYFGLSIFVPPSRGGVVLDGQRNIEIRRCASGDLPDWVAAPWSLRELTVAEAKGSHDAPGPAKALDRAWKQAGRVNILSGGRRASVKRIAVVTRWGVLKEGPHEPWISVHDPIDEGDPMEPDEMYPIFVGLFRHHAANMIARLGHVELAAFLRKLATASTVQDEREAAQQARSLSEDDSAESPSRFADHPGVHDLIGGVVTRAGPSAERSISRNDSEALMRLDLRPVFVGIQRTVIRGLIDGDLSFVEKARLEGRLDGRSDRAGGWIIPLRAKSEDWP